MRRAYDKATRIFLRGHGDVRRLTGNLAGLAVLENRGIDLGYMTMAGAAEWALAYLRFAAYIRAGARGSMEHNL